MIIQVLASCQWGPVTAYGVGLWNKARGLGQGWTIPAGRAPGRPSPRAAGPRAGSTWSLIFTSIFKVRYRKYIRLRQIDSVFPVVLSSENLASQPKNLANLWRETQNQFGAASLCVESPEQTNSHSSDAPYHDKQGYNWSLLKGRQWWPKSRKQNSWWFSFYRHRLILKQIFYKWWYLPVWPRMTNDKIYQL